MYMRFEECESLGCICTKCNHFEESSKGCDLRPCDDCSTDDICSMAECDFYIDDFTPLDEYDEE